MTVVILGVICWDPVAGKPCGSFGKLNGICILFKEIYLLDQNLNLLSPFVDDNDIVAFVSRWLIWIPNWLILTEHDIDKSGFSKDSAKISWKDNAHISIDKSSLFT